ncbi:unnamed protein product [Peniophora sp. CBMAI 1063]|nr:unnamed protein product [Peniophora sp. CBMAI 1063]
MPRALRLLRAVARVVPPPLFIIHRKARTSPAEAALPAPEEPHVLVLASGSTATVATLDAPPTTANRKARVLRFKSKRPSRARRTAKDVLLLSLDALSESSDVFPPLKSVVGGLRFFVVRAELISDNKDQVRAIYAQIGSFAESLVRAIPDVTALSPAHKAAIEALAQHLSAICTDLEMVVKKRSLALRFLRAKRDSAQIQDLSKRLDQAHSAFTRTMLSSMHITTTQILDCVQPMRVEVHRLYRLGLLFFCNRIDLYTETRLQHIRHRESGS